MTAEPESGDNKLLRLDKGIAERMSRIDGTRRDERSELDERMRQLVDLRERFQQTARQFINAEIRPRVDRLLLRLGLLERRIFRDRGDATLYVEIPHGGDVPACIEMVFSVASVDKPDSICLRYDLTILPWLFDYDRHSEKDLTTGEMYDGVAGLWIEDRLLEFVDLYRRLEVEPAYHRDQLVVDPVCGMRIPRALVASRIEVQGKILGFCSVVCRDAFLRTQPPGSYNVLET